MEKKVVKGVLLFLCLMIFLSALPVVYAESGQAVGGSTFKERLQTRSKQFNDTWLNAPRRRHTDSDTSGTRQDAFKKRCKTFNDAWLNAPRRQHTDSSPYEVVAASKKVK